MFEKDNLSYHGNYYVPMYNVRYSFRTQIIVKVQHPKKGENLTRLQHTTSNI